jgi:tetratricopeptide (TPR) repeat protein
LNDSIELYIAKKCRETVASGDRLIRWKSDFAEAYYYRGLENAHLGKTAEAINDMGGAIRRKPSFDLALESRAALNRALNNFAQAISDYSVLIAQRPQDVALPRNRAYLFLSLGNQEAALRDLDSAVQIAPGNHHAIADRDRVRGGNSQATVAASRVETPARVEPPPPTLSRPRPPEQIVSLPEAKLRTIEPSSSQVSRTPLNLRRPNLPGPSLYNSAKLMRLSINQCWPCMSSQ